MQSAVMDPPPRLRLAPGPSRFGRAAVIAACALAIVLLAALPIPMAGLVTGTAAVVAVLARGLWRCAGGVPASLEVGVDRRIAVTDRAGHSRAGSILEDSYVGARLTTIVWRADGEPWWRPAHAILILPDTLRRDEFRRLRVVLRYGWPPVEGETSDVEAG
jgi:hypothetical protein